MPTQTDALPPADAVPDADRSGVYCSFVRISADLLLVWRVCRNGACRRARACRGDGEHCIQHNFPRLPEGVQEWYVRLLRPATDRPLEQVLEDLAGSPAEKAFLEWTEGAKPRPTGSRPAG